jgi:hypothetical protein
VDAIHQQGIVRFQTQTKQIVECVEFLGSFAQTAMLVPFTEDDQTLLDVGFGHEPFLL